MLISALYLNFYPKSFQETKMSDAIEMPDKSWLTECPTSTTFRNGMNLFLDFAEIHSAHKIEPGGRLPCPCSKCKNGHYLERLTIMCHITRNNIDKNYRIWYMHGEMIPGSRAQKRLMKRKKREMEATSSAPTVMENEMVRLVTEAMVDPAENPIIDHTNDPIDDRTDDPFDNPIKDSNFTERLKDANEELYPGCKKYSKLSAILHLYHMKCLNGWTNKSFEMLLEFLRDVIPSGEVSIPKTMHDAKSFLRDVGLNYVKIDACPNNCILYRKELENEESCIRCNEPRWKPERKGNGKPIPVKVLRHFPLVPRLQRLFMCSKVCTDMTWHEDNRLRDGILRHPADTEQWRALNGVNSEFTSEPRNVRLGLASDGFNPFGSMSLSHSTWPVVLIPYNMPPWLCMKQPNFILSLLIPGPEQPGNDIDVYLEPLIDELKLLWDDGVRTYDSVKKEVFTMRAALLWTINDYPAYGNLSGWTTKGNVACGVCFKDTGSLYLKGSRKTCFMRHRRFLESSHPYRKDKSNFNNKIELDEAPSTRSGEDVLDEVILLQIKYTYYYYLVY